MILGICEINQRQHCVGVWPNILQASRELRGAYDISEIPDDVEVEVPLAQTAIKVYRADMVQPGDDSYDPEASRNDCEEESFLLYDYIDNKLPGYCPFDED